MPNDKKTEGKDNWDSFVKELLMKEDEAKKPQPLTQENLRKATATATSKTATPPKTAPRLDPFTVVARAVTTYLKTEETKAKRGTFIYFEYLDDPDDPVVTWGDADDGRPRWVENKRQFFWPHQKGYPRPAPPPPPPSPPPQPQQTLGFSPIVRIETPPTPPPPSPPPQPQPPQTFSPIRCVDSPPSPPSETRQAAPTTPPTREKRRNRKPGKKTPPPVTKTAGTPAPTPAPAPAPQPPPPPRHTPAAPRKTP
ncbi:hypothetical protein BDZ91DRAFT_797794 [Kalaharituber pfeilii]|nr:hypothetical protein BDZ91DRAFT_797794 [Kalaharituber pfeilii]